MEKKEPLCTVGGNVKWYSHQGNNMEIPKKIKIELSFDPTLPFLGTYPQEMKLFSSRDICTLLFIVAFFTIVKECKQPKCPLMDEWMSGHVTHKIKHMSSPYGTQHAYEVASVVSNS